MMSNDVSSGKISNSELESKIRTLHNKMDVMVSVDQVSVVLFVLKKFHDLAISSFFTLSYLTTLIRILK